MPAHLTLPSWLASMSLVDSAVSGTVLMLSVLLGVVALARRRSRRAALVAAGTIAGSVLAAALALTALLDLGPGVGVAVPFAGRSWVVVAVAGLAVGVAAIAGARWWHRLAGAAAAVSAITAAALGVNAVFGVYPTVADLWGRPAPPALADVASGEHGSVEAVGTDYVSTAAGGAPVPAAGAVVSATIPATVSHFAARPATIYLPPAALTAHPPVLPVVLAFSGQPGSPSDLFTFGGLATVLDTFAAAHHGFAPIVISPDQLGAASSNPMCVDSTLGNVDTYVATDVVTWAKSHFRVSSSPLAWGVLGFSEGATCSIQFAVTHPDVFASALAISSELVPTIGVDTVKVAFRGSAAEYARHHPLALMHAHGPFRDSRVTFVAGEQDPIFVTAARKLADGARAAAIATDVLISPGTGHDWNTVRWGLRHGLAGFFGHLGLIPAH
ncbi:MAG: hypothetical protein J0I33_06770 [Microbacterium ginsengisoli]|uniref:alpha/beta hydrolase n=2 Tax=Microbacteriaceae TaxID=85023 RepID=UPI0006F734F7|nr:MULTISPECIES: alpha/beta hydrolase-fold protein [unclassified Microbacterium]KQR94030.1 hypothetical protein ASF93_03690 [Microbacterium sp. Leaf347]KQR97116.1 hypothetical protein ASG00_12650 [Microbacterium sp. Leaf351]MBN9198326.1 hypothetical protein [Microbacterium ginsengisoli]